MRIYISRLHDKNGSQSVRELLAYGFKEIYGEELPEIVKADNGKPYFPTRPDVHFSLSHTDTHVMCVISDSPVGCDIQIVRQVSDRVKYHTCTEKELEKFNFIQLWTLKESWIKLNGCLDRKIKSIEFAGIPDNIAPPFPATRAGLYEIEDCIAAVCTSGAELSCDIIKIEIV